LTTTNTASYNQDVIAPVSSDWSVAVNGVKFPAVSGNLSFVTGQPSTFVFSLPYHPTVQSLPYGSFVELSVMYDGVWYEYWEGMIARVTYNSVLEGDMATVSAVDYWGYMAQTSLVPPEFGSQFIFNIPPNPDGLQDLWYTICDQIQESAEQYSVPSVYRELYEWVRNGVIFTQGASDLFSSMVAVKDPSGALSQTETISVLMGGALESRLSKIHNHWEALSALASVFGFELVPHQLVSYGKNWATRSASLSVLAPGYYETDAKHGAATGTNNNVFMVSRALVHKEFLPKTRYMSFVNVNNQAVFNQIVGPSTITGHYFGSNKWMITGKNEILGPHGKLEEKIGIRPMKIQNRSMLAGQKALETFVSNNDISLVNTKHPEIIPYIRSMDIMFYMEMSQNNIFSFKYLFSPYSVPGYSASVCSRISPVRGYFEPDGIGILSSVTHTFGPEFDTTVTISNYSINDDMTLAGELVVSDLAAVPEHLELASVPNGFVSHVVSGEDSAVTNDIQKNIKEMYHL